MIADLAKLLNYIILYFSAKKAGYAWYVFNNKSFWLNFLNQSDIG